MIPVDSESLWIKLTRFKRFAKKLIIVSSIIYPITVVALIMMWADNTEICMLICNILLSFIYFGGLYLYFDFFWPRFRDWSLIQDQFSMQESYSMQGIFGGFTENTRHVGKATFSELMIRMDKEYILLFPDFAYFPNIDVGTTVICQVKGIYLIEIKKAISDV